MTGLMTKLIGIPILIYLANLFIPGLGYINVLQVITVGVIIASVGHLLEAAFLKSTTITTNTVLDFLTSFGIIYLSDFYFPEADVNVTGALLTAALITIGEYFLHQYLVKTKKTQKSE